MKIYSTKLLLFSAVFSMLSFLAHGQEQMRPSELPPRFTQNASRQAPAGVNKTEAVVPLGYLGSNVIKLFQPFVRLTSANSQKVRMPNNNDDDNSAAQAIGFNFKFRNTIYPYFVMNTNGFIKLGQEPPSRADMYFSGSEIYDVNGPLYSLALGDTNMISAFNFNLVPISPDSGLPEFRVATSGTAPNRVCTIQWRNMQDALGPDAVALQYNRMEFQIKLYENTNFIDFVYGNWVPANLDDAIWKGAQVGLRGGKGPQYLFGSKASRFGWGATIFTEDNQQFGINQHNFRSEVPPDLGFTYRFTTTLDKNVGTKQIIRLPGPACSQGIVDSVGVVVINSGGTAQTNVPVRLVIDKNPTRSKVVPFLQAGVSDTLWFGPYDFSKTGNYGVVAYTELIGDQLRGNDTLRADSVQNIIPKKPDCKVNTFDDETSLIGFVQFNLNNDGFTWTNANDSTRSHSGSNFLYLPNSASIGSKDMLESGCFGLKKGNIYRAKWYMTNLNQIGAAKMKLFVLTDQTGDTTHGVQVWRNDNFRTYIGRKKNYEAISATFKIYTTGSYYLAWYAYSDKNTNLTAIDDVSLCLVDSFATTISKSSLADSTCPTVCSGGFLTLKIPSLKYLDLNSTLQAVISSPRGQNEVVLPIDSFSLASAGPYKAGPYVIAQDVIQNLYVKVRIPTSIPVGGGYNLRFQTTANRDTINYLSCAGGTKDNLAIISTTVLPPVPESARGVGKWIGHTYSWVPTTKAPINTPALVAQQKLFSPPLYKGHIDYSSLNLDLDFGALGGSLGVSNLGSSIPCDSNKKENFCVRLLRKEKFSPGRYRFTIQGDDAVRFSVDSGKTWLLDSYIEQGYASSFKSTDAAYPKGFCLTDSAILVIEYFQHSNGARLTFSSTLLSVPITNPQQAFVCLGQDTAFSVGKNDPNNTYQWEVSTNNGGSFSPITGSAVYTNPTSPRLGIVNAPNDYSGYIYRCRIGLGCQTAVTDTASLRITNSAQIATQPSDVKICGQPTGTFKISGTGGGLKYRWQADTGTGVYFNVNVINNPTAQTSQLTVKATDFKNGTKFRCILSGACGGSTSLAATLTVSPPTLITTQPTDVKLCNQASGTFTVAASGPGVSYQWQVNTGSGYGPVPGTGSQNPQLTVAAADYPSGAKFKCLITSTCKDTSSAEAAFVIQTPTAITVQPANANTCSASSSFSVATVGSNVTYVWQSSPDGTSWTTVTNGAVYAGTTTSALVITNVAGLNGTQYRAIATGECGAAVTSSAATLTVSPPTLITTQPTDVKLCNQASGTFTVAATGSGISYQWQVSTGGSYSAVAAPAGQNPQLNVAAADYPAGAKFKCIIKSTCKDTSSSEVAFVVQTPTAITTQPANANACKAGTTIPVAAVGTNLTYVWQSSPDGTSWTPVTEGGVYAGTTTNTLAISNVDGLNGIQYRVIITGDCGGAVTSSVATLTVYPPTVISTQPADIKLCNQTSGAFTVAATGSGIGYQWQFNAGTGFQNVAGAAGQAATLPVAVADYPSGGVFRCVIKSSTCGDTNSATASLVLQQPTALVAQPAAVTTCQNAVNFTAQATGTNLTYTWQKSDNNGVDWGNLNDGGAYAGTTSASLSISGVQGLNGKQYRVVVNGDCGSSVTSSGALLTLQTPAVITTQPQDVRLCTNNAEMTAQATGTNLTYMWQSSTDGGNTWSSIQASDAFQNVTTPILKITKGLGLSRQLIRVEVKGDCNSDVFSSSAQLSQCGDTCYIGITNVLTPNGDGANDELFSTHDCKIDAFSMRVYNRWGRLVFSSDDVTNIWNASNNHSDPAGVYFYYITYSVDGKTSPPKRGYVELVR